MRNKLLILLAFSLCFAFPMALTSQVSAKKPEFKLKCAQAMMPKDSLTHQMMMEMCENITKRTDGAVTWKFFGPEVGDWLELERMTMKETRTTNPRL